MQVTYKYDKRVLRFYVPTKQDIYPMYDTLVIDTYRQLFERLKPNDIVLDAGAHVGFFAIPASFKAKLVIAVEPLPRNYRYLVKNVELNKRKNIIVINQALSDYVGKGNLSGTSDYGHLSNNGEESVKVTTIDALLSNLGIMNFQVLKMDIEGAEPLAMSGLFLNYLNNIAVEVHGKKNEEIVRQILESSDFDVRLWQYSMMHSLSNVATKLSDIFMAECKTRFDLRFYLKQWIITRFLRVRSVDPLSYRQILLGSKYVDS